MLSRQSPDDLYPSSIGFRVKTLRARLGITQARLAEIMGVSFVTVSRWENGASNPSQAAITTILEAEARGMDAFGLPVPEPAVQPAMDPQFLDFLADPEKVKTFVEGERLGYGHLFNPVFATETSLIDPLPHQRIAVYEHMLPQSRLRFLLADDAGAGKTIMTGMYVREMLVRRLIRRVLIVPPAGLVGNWYKEMHKLFSLPFQIASGADARLGNPFIGEDSDLRIVSVDTLAGERMFSRLQEPSVQPYDLVIFDESHKLSANRDPDLYVRKTERYKLAEALTGLNSEDPRWQLNWTVTHLLLLTATPHMGKDYPYFALWRLLEPETLSTPDAFAAFPRESRRRHFIRRVKEEMVDLAGRPLYPNRETSTHSYDLKQGETSEQRLYDETTKYIRDFYNRSRILNRSAARMVMSVFQRRLASSTWALFRSLQRRLDRLEELINKIQTGELDEEQLKALQRKSEKDAHDVFEEKTADEESSDREEEENEIAETAVIRGVIATSLAELEAERMIVRDLTILAEKVYNLGDESKFEKLRGLLEDPKYKDEKVLIFSEHKDTLNFLVRRLEGMGYTGKVAKIHGGMPYQDREEQVEYFRKPGSDGGATYMVATDAAGEGINLQFCWLMVNYDIPWNPARLEQRMGRVHRYKQKHDPVIIINLVAGKTREGRVVKTLLDKLERMRKELNSDKVFDVIGRLFEGVSLKAYLEDSITEAGAERACKSIEGSLTPDQLRAYESKQQSIFGNGGDVRSELDRLRKESDQEVYRRLLPGYVLQYVEKAAPFVNIELRGEANRYFSFVAKKRGSLDPLLPLLETHTPEEREKLTVYRPSDEDGAIWLHPGESLFERFRAMASSRLSPAARRGATFTDANTDRPYLFHVARVSVVRKADPELPAFRNEEVLEVSLVAVRQYLNGDIEECPIEQLLVLKGSRSSASQYGSVIVSAKEQENAAKTWIEKSIAQTRADKFSQTMRDGLPGQIDFLARGYDYQEAELLAQRSRLFEKARLGDSKAKGDLTRIRERQLTLSLQESSTIRERQREPDLIRVGEIEILAHALVVPSDDPEDKKRQDAVVEMIAMRMAMAFEDFEGADVQDVHTPELARKAGLQDNPGFDLLSKRPNGEKRCIEVKGKARIGDVDVSANEWPAACNLGNQYWFYVVFDCASAHPQLLRVQDPFNKLLARARSFLIDEKSIFTAAEA
jgi:superfamily II DNA or RNA helicase/DNA-binding XRE family transcriptional regulator